MATRRGWGEDGIYFDHAGPCTDSDRHRHCPGRWRGAVSLGYGPDGRRRRRRVSGRSKAEVQHKLRDPHDNLDAGITPRAGHTLRQAAADWLAEGLRGRSPKTIKKNENVLAPILAATGARRLTELTAADVHQALAAMAGRYQARDLVGRNEIACAPIRTARSGCMLCQKACRAS